MKQFLRSTQVRIGSMIFKTPDLYIEFTVPFDDDLEPNESEIKIWNLSRDTINRMKRNDQVSITAGYRGDTGVILTGRLSYVKTLREGAESVTYIYVLDGSDLTEKKAVQKAYKKGVKADTVMKDLLKQLKLPIALYKLPKNPAYKEGLSVDGNLIDTIKQVAEECGAYVFINKGRVFVGALNTGQDLKFTLSAETGLIESPEQFEEEESKGWRIRSLLQHRITTASIIRLESRMVKGTFRVRKGSHTSSGDDFVTEMEVV